MDWLQAFYPLEATSEIRKWVAFPQKADGGNKKGLMKMLCICVTPGFGMSKFSVVIVSSALIQSYDSYLLSYQGYARCLSYSDSYNLIWGAQECKGQRPSNHPLPK